VLGEVEQSRLLQSKALFQRGVILVGIQYYYPSASLSQRKALDLAGLDLSIQYRYSLDAVLEPLGQGNEMIPRLGVGLIRFQPIMNERIGEKALLEQVAL
jgi:hypothetical protein